MDKETAKAIDELRGVFVAMQGAVLALCDTHPKPAAVLERFIGSSEQTTASMLATAMTEDALRAHAHFVNQHVTYLRSLVEPTTEKNPGA